MHDLIRIARAVASNQLARVAPAAYVRLTGQTGRGAKEEESSSDIAAYFCDSVDAYFQTLGIAPNDVPAFLSGKILMEYGPGDLPGVAALMVARGAEKVYCVDRFPLVNLGEKNARVIRDLLNACKGIEKERLLSCLANQNDPAAGFNPSRVECLVTPNGLSRLTDAVDLVISRAVLEHVNDLDATFADMVEAMRPGAKAIHLVDLKSHGLHKQNPLDFLEWSSALWMAMYSNKGVPNRWRVDKYRSIVDRLPVRLSVLKATTLASKDDVAEVRPRLASAFRATSEQDLGWLGFWLGFEKLEQ